MTEHVRNKRQRVRRNSSIMPIRMMQRTCLLIVVIGASALYLAAYAVAASSTPDDEAGKPYFGKDFAKVPLIDVRVETHDTRILTFGLPDEGTALNLPVSSALLMKVVEEPTDDEDEVDEDENDDKKKKKKPKDIVRPYNPISSHERTGSFDLLMKFYPEGKAGTYVSGLKAGDFVEFKQTKHNIKKFRYPFFDNSEEEEEERSGDRITMLAGGTGIAPMIQALYPILETPGDATRVRLLFGNKRPRDIALKAELDALASKHGPDRFRVHYVVGEFDGDIGAAADVGVCGDAGNDDNSSCATEDGDDPYERGWIDEEKIRRLGFGPSEDDDGGGKSIVWVCGVDAMYDALAGSRLKPLTEESVLYRLGFRDDQVWRS